MNFQITFKVNENLYLRDPEVSELGKQIVKASIDLIYELGFEQFTFKKLAKEISSTEASIYRYFENKHRLLLYILNWYWSCLEFNVMFELQNITDPKAKLKYIIQLLTQELPANAGHLNYNRKYLNHIIISESSKAYFVKDIEQINKEEAFKPYKDLCAQIALIIKAYNPRYAYAKSLTTTLIETAHDQQYFSTYLPKLTDASLKNKSDFTASFLEDFLFKVLK